MTMMRWIKRRRRMCKLKRGVSKNLRNRKKKFQYLVEQAKKSMMWQVRKERRKTEIYKYSGLKHQNNQLNLFKHYTPRKSYFEILMIVKQSGQTLADAKTLTYCSYRSPSLHAKNSWATNHLWYQKRLNHMISTWVP